MRRAFLWVWDSGPRFRLVVRADSILGGTPKGEGKMKPIKVLVLAALAAVMAMAFAGVSSAMAEPTALCSSDPGEGSKEVCPPGELVTHLHAATEPTNKAKLLTNITTVECEALVLGDAVEELSAPLVIEGSFTYTSCSGNCTLTEENGPSELVLLKSGYETADLTIEWLAHLVCAGINCRYSSLGLETFAKGALLPIEESEFETWPLSKESGLFCPSSTKLDLVIYALDEYYITR